MNFILNFIVFIIVIILMFIAIRSTFLEDYTPNYDAIEEVTAYYNTRVACDSEWIELCNRYKEEKNVTFNCFNKKWWVR